MNYLDIANAEKNLTAKNAAVKSVDYKGFKVQIEKTASGWSYTVFQGSTAKDSAGGYPSEQAALSDAKAFID